MENMTRRERERQVREDEIIEAAEKIFCEKGFDEASMDEIAVAAQFTRRTLYKYFANKEDLYFAAALKGFKLLSSYFEKEIMKEKTGYMKIYRSSVGYYNFYKDHPEKLRLMNYIGHVRMKSKDVSTKNKDLLGYNYQLFKSIAEIIEEGIADGSIRPDLDAQKASFSLCFAMTGIFNQLSTTGESFTKSFDLDVEDLCTFIMDLIFKSIKGNKEE